jgi:hypothetical protein
MTRNPVSRKTRKRSKYSKKYNRNKSVRGGDSESDIDGEKVATKAILELKSLAMAETKKSNSPPKNIISELKELSNNDNIPNGSPKFMNEADKIIIDGINDIAADTAGAKVKVIYDSFSKKISGGSKKEALDGIDALLRKLKETMKQNKEINKKELERYASEPETISILKKKILDSEKDSENLLNGLLSKRNELANISFEPNSKSTNRSRFIKIAYALVYSLLAITFTVYLSNSSIIEFFKYINKNRAYFFLSMKHSTMEERGEFLYKAARHHLVKLPWQNISNNINNVINSDFYKYFSGLVSQLH